MQSLQKFVWPNDARIAVVVQVSFDQTHGDRAMRGPEWQDSDSRSPSHLFRNHGALLSESKQAYGDVGMWRVTELLDRYEITATGVFSAL